MKELELKNKIKKLSSRGEISLGDNLVLEKLPSGKMKWRYRSKNKKILIGDYPLLSQTEAREKCNEIKRNIVLGYTDKSFEEIYKEWLSIRMIPIYTPKYIADTTQRISRFMKVYGSMPIKNIKSMHILEVIRKTEQEGHFSVAERIKQICGQVFRFAIASDYVQYDPTYALKDALQPYQEKHFPKLTAPKEIGKLMAAIDTYPNFTIRNLLKMHIYTFVRPTELRLSQWEEIRNNEWVIPKERMKMKREHIVPLSKQVKKILKDMANDTRYIFPNFHTGKPYSDMAENKALRTLGFNIVSHGFRGTASTILHENGFRSDIVEIQLAHIDKNTVRATYNDATYMNERKAMLQWWADWLDQQKKEASKASSNTGQDL